MCLGAKQSDGDDATRWKDRVTNRFSQKDNTVEHFADQAERHQNHGNDLEDVRVSSERSRTSVMLNSLSLSV